MSTEHLPGRSSVSRAVKMANEGLYAVQVFRPWHSVSILGLPLSASGNGGSAGFIPVFPTLALARAWRDDQHPGAEIMKLEPVPRPEKEIANEQPHGASAGDISAPTPATPRTRKRNQS